MENVKQFYDALATNEALKEKAEKLNGKYSVTNPDEIAVAKEIIAFATAEGYTFTAEELKAYSESVKVTAKAVNDDELDAVAGGKTHGDCLDCFDTCFCVVGGGGKHNDPKFTCACVVGGGGKKCKVTGYGLECFAAGGIFGFQD